MMNFSTTIIRAIWRTLPASFRTRVNPIIRSLGARGMITRLFCGALLLLAPVVRYRFAMLLHHRIGHLAIDTDAFIRRAQLNGRPPRTVFVFVYLENGYAIANNTLFSLWKRHVPVVDRGIFQRFLSFVWPQFRLTSFVIDISSSNREYKEFGLGNSVLNFTSAEEEQGRQRLRAMGIGENDWFVCFHNRDASYLNVQMPGRDFSYHDFRDSKIENYIEAAKLVSRHGGFALRMGALVQKKLGKIGDPRIIDYANSYRNDFMDIYLSAKCRFFLGASSGMAQVPLIFDRPIAYVNCIPLGTLHYGRCSLFIPKLFRRENQFINFRELKSIGVYNSIALHGTFYRERNIEVVDNSSDDILDLTMDMFDLLEGRPPLSDAIDLQRFYKEQFFGDDPDRGYAPNIGPRFALKYRDLIFA